MILDIAVIVILAAAMVQGFRNGFVYTFLHMTGWLLAIVLGFVWSPAVKSFLLDKTDYYESIQKSLSEKFSESIHSSITFADSFPRILQKSVDAVTSAAANSFAASMTELIFTIACFVAVVLLIKLLLWIIIGCFSKKHAGGLTAFLDGVAGMCAGLVKGCLLVFVLLALMVPVTALASEQFELTFQGWLSASSFACDLYDNNLILLILRDFLL